MTGPLQNEVALVTGGGRGLGEAIATGLAKADAAVALVARSHSQIVRVANAIEADGGKAFAIACDVTDAQSVKTAFSTAREALGPISVLVNNAGVQGPIGPIGSIDAAEWWRAQEVHVLGAMLCMTEALEDMAPSRRGRIINIASQAGTFVAVNASAYAVAKASLIRLTEHVDAEQRENGIHAFAIQPGTILTDMASETLSSPAARKYAAPLVSLLESVTPEASRNASRKLQQFVVNVASGHFDRLSGRYLDVDSDLSAMLAEQD